MNNLLIVLLGPTGIGKSDIAIDLARHFKCEIISADSRQFFKEMKTGTAVPSEKQLREITHHFIRFLPAEKYYSSSMFERDVLKLLPDLFSKNRIVLLTGGSAMYIDAVCEGTDEIPDVEITVREKFIKKYDDEGIEGLRLALKLLDPEHYKKVDLKNPKRMIRALEICESTGQPYSSFLTRQKKKREFDIIKIGLTRPRQELYDRINRRVDEMIAGGLEEEARNLYSMRHLNALNSVGYKEFFEFFDRKITKEKAIDLIKRNTRRYAKRQMTWWAKDKDIHWVDPTRVTEIIKFIEDSSVFQSSLPDFPS